MTNSLLERGPKFHHELRHLSLLLRNTLKPVEMGQWAFARIGSPCLIYPRTRSLKPCQTNSKTQTLRPHLSTKTQRKILPSSPGDHGLRQQVSKVAPSLPHCRFTSAREEHRLRLC